MRRLIIFISVLSFSCDNETSNRQPEINTLKSSLRLVIRENQRILNLLELKRNGNAAANPYLAIGTILNKFILSSIDTTFSHLSVDSNLVKVNLARINIRYTALIDSFAKSYKYKQFLTDDDSLLHLPICKYLFTTKDDIINHFILTQNILYSHMNNLIMISQGVGECNMRFFAFEKAGYQINSIQINSLTKIKLHYNFPKYWADYKLIELINIVDSDEKKVKTADIYKTENDTLKLTLVGATQKTFTANIKYSVLTPTGDKNEKIIEFPFSLW